MSKKILKIKYLDNYRWKPMEYSKPGDACFDAKAAIDQPLTLEHPTYTTRIFRYTIPLGFKVEIPKGYELQIRMRSGLARDYGLIMSNGMGTIDAGYRGQVMALITNLGYNDVVIKPGDRIVQCKIAEVPQFELVTVDELSETERGEGGFGHTGI